MLLGILFIQLKLAKACRTIKSISNLYKFTATILKTGAFLNESSNCSYRMVK